jgi:hypothetical protein
MSKGNKTSNRPGVALNLQAIVQFLMEMEVT